MDSTALAEEYRILALAFLSPELEEERVRVFGHIMSADCPQCETQWSGDPAGGGRGLLGPSQQTFHQAQDLADIAGYYRAWGLRPAAGGERADHIAAELEFAGFLAWKEAAAAAAGDSERAAIAREARGRFLAEHLGRWTPSFTMRLEKLAGAGPFADVARQLRGIIEAETAAFGVPVPAAPLAPRDPEAAAESSCFECIPGLS